MKFANTKTSWLTCAIFKNNILNTVLIFLLALLPSLIVTYSLLYTYRFQSVLLKNTRLNMLFSKKTYLDLFGYDLPELRNEKRLNSAANLTKEI